MSNRYRGTYIINCREDRARKNLPIFQERWKEQGGAELWRLFISPQMIKDSPYHKEGDRWQCFIIKQPGTPKQECKEAHIMGVIEYEDAWERLG